MLYTHYKTSNEAGTDEAGRGCLAGPVTAASIILPTNFKNQILNDSKQLSHRKRELLLPILENEALAFSVCHVSEQEIDSINILQASILGMHRCLEQLKATPVRILVDGNKFKPFKDIPHVCIVKGDSKYMSIAAASVLAKTSRDAYMTRLHEEYPRYNWAKNKGYPTKEHREAIRKFGLTEHHRKSFRQLPEQIRLEFL